MLFAIYDNILTHTIISVTPEKGFRHSVAHSPGQYTSKKYASACREMKSGASPLPPKSRLDV